jgi:hypothetical protein
MSNHIVDFISATVQDKPVAAYNAFTSEIENRLDEKLKAFEQDVKSKMFNAEAKDYDEKKKKDDMEDEDQVEEEAEDEDEGDDKGLTDKQKKLPPGLRKAIAKKQANEEKDEDEDEDEGDEKEGLTDKQKKLPPGLQKAIAKKQAKEETELAEAQDMWKVTVKRPINKLKKGQSVEVSARNTAEAMKKATKQWGETQDLGSQYLEVQKQS